MTADAVGGVWTYALELARRARRARRRVDARDHGRAARPRQRADAARDRDLDALESRSGWNGWRPVGRRDARGRVAARRWRARDARRRPPQRLRARSAAVAGAGAWWSPTPASLSWWQAVHGGAPPPSWRSLSPASVARGLARAPRGGRADAPHAARARRALRSAARARIGDPQRPRPLRGPAGREGRRSCSPPGGSGTTAKNLAALDGGGAGAPWPVMRGGDARTPDGGARSAPRRRALGPLDAAR